MQSLRPLTLELALDQVLMHPDFAAHVDGSRIGAFGPLHENNGVRTFARTDIVSVEHDERHLRFRLRHATVTLSRF